MSNSNCVQDAIAFHLKRQGMAVRTVKLYVSVSSVSVIFDVHPVQVVQMLCWNGRSDLAADFREKVSSAQFFLDATERSYFEQIEYMPGADPIHPELEPTLARLYLLQYRDVLVRAADVLEAAQLACMGPTPTSVRKFSTAGGFTVALTAESPPMLDAERYFKSGDPEANWAHMLHAFETPFHVFDLTCTIIAPSGQEIGKACFLQCTANSMSALAFAKDTCRRYARDIFHRTRQAFSPRSSAVAVPG